MIRRMDVADVGRLYAKAAAENALIEIELDTQQLRAITDQEARDLLEDHAYPQHAWSTASVEHGTDPEFNDSLEALLRLSWPVWKATS
jgi:hypothetical protein